MANKEKIDHLLLDIRELEKKIASMRDAEIYPVSFFSTSYEMIHKLLTDLHIIEAEQLEVLSRQMEAHRLKISSISLTQATAQPSTEEVNNEINNNEEINTDIPPENFDKTVQNEEQKISLKEDRGTAQIPLSEILEKKILSDFRKAFSLNDRFRFRRELFGGDENRMNKAITDLNDIHSVEESITYLHQELQWNIEDESVADFLKLIEKRFM